MCLLRVCAAPVCYPALVPPFMTSAPRPQPAHLLFVTSNINQIKNIKSSNKKSSVSDIDFKGLNLHAVLRRVLPLSSVLDDDGLLLCDTVMKVEEYAEACRLNIKLKNLFHR